MLDGERMPGGAALARAGLAPVTLAAKEGLALINGTHLMAAAGRLAVRDARRVLEAAVVAVALSLEAFKGSTVPFDARLHDVRGQPGPAGSPRGCGSCSPARPIVASHADCGRVQDPYTLRCAPQVLGAIDDALDYVERRSSARALGGHRQPARLRRRRRRSSPAATSTGSRSRCRSTTSRSR